MITKKERVVFQSHWTPDSIKQFRKKHLLIQQDLAFLLKTSQQRINEWEQGIHGMKRAYTHMMDEIENKVSAIRRRAGSNHTKYAELMLSTFGIELREEKWKSKKAGKKKSATHCSSAT